MRELTEKFNHFIIVTLAIGASMILVAGLARFVGDIFAHVAITIVSIFVGTLALHRLTSQARTTSEIQLSHQFRLLNDINTQLASAEDLDEIYRLSVTLGVKKLGFERFALFLYDEEQQNFYGTYGIDTDGELRDERSFVQPVQEMQRPYKMIINGDEAKIWQDMPLLDDNKIIGIGWNALALIRDKQQVIGWLATDNFITHKPIPSNLLDVMNQYGILIGNHISRKRRETQLKETEQRFFTAFHSNPAGIVIVRMSDRTYVDVNEAFMYIFGYTREEVLGKTPDQLSLYVEESERNFVMSRLQQHQPIRGMNLKGRRKDGQLIYGRISTEVIELNGQPHYLVMSEDVTEQKRAEEALRQTKADLEERVLQRTRDLQLAMDVSREIANVLDLDKLLPKLVRITCQSFNLYAVSIFIWSPQHKALTLLVASVHGQQEIEFRNGIFTDEDVHGMVLHAQKTREIVLSNDVNQSHIYSEVEEFPLTRSELTLPLRVGEHYLGVLDLQSDAVNRFSDEDVRILKSLAETISIAIQNAQLYAQQVKLAEDLQNVDSMKSQFLASMSHELRTPLNAILNFTKFVARGTLGEINPRQVDALEKVITSGQHLLSLINDVLDISKIEANKMTLFIENDVDIINELSTAIDTGRNLLLERNSSVEIVTDFDGDIPPVVGDKRRLRQVFLNLISNACKFTQEGKITVRARYQGDHVVIGIIDTGPGIPEEDHDKIFSAFQQTGHGIRQNEGTGLGLPISQQLVKAHDGELWLESTLNKGSAFFVKIPICANRLLAQLDDSTNHKKSS